MVMAAMAGQMAPDACWAAERTLRQGSGEKDPCIKNLKAINEAIQACQADHKDLPNWLSDLVPQYLPDPNVLVCPPVDAGRADREH